MSRRIDVPLTSDQMQALVVVAEMVREGALIYFGPWKRLPENRATAKALSEARRALKKATEKKP